ncbi:MAG: hypothetical protein LBD55_03715 [Treponema sp.]|nr:hypothetical protein [Treponema sp.]
MITKPFTLKKQPLKTGFLVFRVMGIIEFQPVYPASPSPAPLLCGF